MTLAALLAEVQTGDGPLTVGRLAHRLGSSPGEVSSMLAALRAAGLLRTESRSRPGSDTCPTSGSCARACPGPAACPFVIDIGSTLEIRR